MIINDQDAYKILTIDDESYIRQSIRTYLEDYGFIVFEAENGKKGLEVFEKERPDLVLLDLRMPEMDGLQVLENLRKTAPDVPLVVASGTGNITAVVEALHLGASDYILKPIEDMKVLYHSVNKCLGESRLKRENKAYQEQLEEIVKDRTEELRASEEKYKAIFEYTGTAAMILEKDGTIAMINSRLSEMIGMPKEDIVGQKKWFDFIPEDDADILQNYIDLKSRKPSESNSPLQYEIRFFGADSRVRFVYVSVGLIPNTDRIVVSLLDITDRKLAEQRWRSLEKQLRKSQKMEAIGTLAGGIAHDLNNILSPVLGYSDMILRTTEVDSSIYRRTRKIQQAALRAADLVSQVLAFNRRNEEEKRTIKIHPVVKEVLKLLRGSIPSTIKIVDEIDRNCGYVEADPTQIHQVVMNLCTNAYHAMEEKGGTLTVKLREVELSQQDILDYPNLMNGGGTYVSMQINDSGTGMSEDIIDRIFDPYFTTKEEGKGTGLGLATVYSIVHTCKGDIRVQSMLGEGTTFTILLPVITKENPALLSGKENTPLKPGMGKRILVIDDDEDIAEMCREGFESIGYKVDMFFSSVEALDFFRKNQNNIDIVVTDQTMPDITGFELAKEMLEAKKDLPIILCSGYMGSLNLGMLKEAGIKRFMMKPVSMEDLSAQVQNLLKLS
ncbi:MAG: response regulator [Desulfobacteraceae bacterium]|nr:MAG: response regulator [Desulfobacteraceae bacterium]